MDELHHEVRPARLGRAGVEHAGDVRMVHHRQGLPLGLEAGDHLPGVHARLDDLEGDLAADRLRLLGHEDDAKAAFADLLQQLVGADDRADAFGDGCIVDRGLGGRSASQKVPAAVMDPQQVLDARSHFQIVADTPRPGTPRALPASACPAHRKKAL